MALWWGSALLRALLSLLTGTQPGPPPAHARIQTVQGLYILASPRRLRAARSELHRTEEWKPFSLLKDGKTYFVILGCLKQYGWCIPLAGRATYVGKLNNGSKWLEDYRHQPGQGLIKISLRPDGKKKVTYLIEYAAKVKLINKAIDLQLRP